MRGLIDEINELPAVARKALDGHMGLKLPVDVPYVGMGASYNAALAMQYSGRRIAPFVASEYFGYLNPGVLPLGVLLSQSGESSETKWCRDLFVSYVAIVNDIDSTLALDARVEESIDLMAGPEDFSSTKTFVNMLVVLYLGLGIDPTAAVERLERDFDTFADQAKRRADEMTAYFERYDVRSMYVVGSGPNVATAHQVALASSETLKRSWCAMSIGQYDHGPKETAENSAVILLDARGREASRVQSVRETLRDKSNALVVDVVEDEVGETLSPIPLAVKSFLLMDALADRLDVGQTFAMGKKVTSVSDAVRPLGA